MAIERRLTEIAGRVGGTLHTARSRNDQVATDVVLFVRDAAGGGAPRARRAGRGAARRAPSRTSTGRCPATRISSARSPSTSATTCSPTSGCSCATASASRACIDACGVLPLGAGALAGVNFATDRELVAARARLRERRRRTRSTPSPTATSRSTTSPPRRPPRPTSRAWAPSSCCGAARSSASASSPTPGARAPRSCRRRRTPTRPSCCARRRRGSPATSAALHGVLHGLPLTYNKDMQEDKEHLFDTADTLALSLAAARGMLETRRVPTASAWRPRRPTR